VLASALMVPMAKQPRLAISRLAISSLDGLRVHADAV
jgi:hypothetical protein